MRRINPRIQGLDDSGVAKGDDCIYNQLPARRRKAKCSMHSKIARLMSSHADARKTSTPQRNARVARRMRPDGLCGLLSMRAIHRSAVTGHRTKRGLASLGGGTESAAQMFCLRPSWRSADDATSAVAARAMPCMSQAVLMANWSTGQLADWLTGQTDRIEVHFRESLFVSGQ